MPEYRFYAIKPDGHIEQLPTVVDCPNDLAAISGARQRLGGHDIEIWKGPRLIAYVVADETKQMPPPRSPDADQHK